MNKKPHPPQLVKEKLLLAKKVAGHHFGKGIKNIEFKPAGATNFVFEFNMQKTNYIVRIADAPSRYNAFIKEQWATHKAMKVGVPVPDILEIGFEIIETPYMIQRKSEGTDAVDHPNRMEILKELGRYARLIHSIPTNGFGQVFDWSKNTLSRRKSWVDFLENELELHGAIKFLQQHHFLTSKKISKLLFLAEKMKKWKVQPVLNHSDLRLKNVIVNTKGEIQAIIDWENCISGAAPFWDFSIALHDLSLDGKQQFLTGYRADYRELNNKGYALTVFNLINYIPDLRHVLKQRNKSVIELYRLRLNATLDLFSF